MKTWMYYIPLIGLILFVWKSEIYDYNNWNIKEQPPVVHITRTPLLHSLFVLIQATTGGILLLFGVIMPLAKLIQNIIS